VLVVLGSLGLAAAGCTDGATGVADPEAARTFVAQLTRVSVGMAAMNGAEVAGGIQAMLRAGQLAVGPADGKTTAGHVVLTSAPFAGSGVCVAAVCDLMSYRASILLEENFLIDGSITRTADLTTFGFKYNESGKFSTAHWDFDGRLVTTGARIDAVFHVHGLSSDDVTWDLVIQVEEAVIDAVGCPTSGTLESDVRYLDNGGPRPDDPGRSPSFEINGSVELGPGCGLP